MCVHDSEELMVKLLADLLPAGWTEIARKQFKKVLAEKVAFICSKECYPQSIDRRLEEVNEIINSGRKIGIEELTPFTKGVVASLFAELKALKYLEMTGEMLIVLRSALKAPGGVPEDLLPPLFSEIKEGEQKT